IKEKYANATLTMVGADKDGSLEHTKKWAEQNKIKVNFTGKLTKEQWTELAQNHDIFINTTHFDNTPVSIIESMALGLPIVSTNVGGIPYLLSHNKNALLVEDNNAQQMADAIEILLNNEAIVQKITQNAIVHANTMNWSQVKEQW
ncbi:MAG TPA: glycosyl transferase family 1, partial [Flavobacterium sp.]|nr:glycosyl transferase family 1 [Flavobacterium sp.]